MTSHFEVGTLSSRWVRLEPLTTDHVSDLTTAALEDRASYDFTRVPDSATEVRRYVEDLLERGRAGETIPFAQVEPTSGVAVGVTRYLSLRSRGPGDLPYAVEIGGTWLAASRQRTSLNSAAKLLLVDHAFATWRCRRVDFKTDERNARSRAALLRLGAQFEGVLRGWQPSQLIGEEYRFRHTAMFSILDDEWPDARAALAARIEAYGAT